MSDDSTNDIVDPAKRVGRVLKRVRFDRDMTLDEAAELTGVSKTMLGQIERGSSSPTISILWKIAKGLRISLSNLLNEDELQYKAVNIEEDIQPVYDADKKMVLYDVFPFNPINGFEYFYIKLLPHTVHPAEAHRDSMEEYIVVTQGTLSLTVDNKTYILKAPACISFMPNVPHIYANDGDDVVVFQNIMKY